MKHVEIDGRPYIVGSNDFIPGANDYRRQLQGLKARAQIEWFRGHMRLLNPGLFNFPLYPQVDFFTVIENLQIEISRLKSTLKWYGENVNMLELTNREKGV